MARLIYFLAFIVGLVLVMNISSYQKNTVSNEKFDFQKVADMNAKKEKEIEELMKPKKEEVAEVKVVKAGPLVELTTPELQNGHDIYKAKCIVCHGKRGEGKAGQKAPSIGGQYDWYIKTQVANMKSGVRVNKVMNPYIARLSDQDISDLAQYVSKLPYMGRK